VTRSLSQIDSWVGLISNGKNLGNQISIIKMSNDKKIVIKRIKILFENKIERINKNLKLKCKIKKKIKLTNESKTKKNINFQRRWMKFKKKNHEK